MKDKKERGTPTVKKFAKEYGLNRPVENEYDYPKALKKPAAKPAAKSAAKAPAKKGPSRL